MVAEDWSRAAVRVALPLVALEYVPCLTFRSCPP